MKATQRYQAILLRGSRAQQRRLAEDLERRFPGAATRVLDDLRELASPVSGEGLCFIEAESEAGWRRLAETLRELAPAEWMEVGEFQLLTFRASDQHLARVVRDLIPEAAIA